MHSGFDFKNIISNTFYCLNKFCSELIKIRSGQLMLEQFPGSENNNTRNKVTSLEILNKFEDMRAT